MKTALDLYDDYPSEMRRYLKNYGWHFNKAACDFAISILKRKDKNGKSKPVEPYSKEQVNSLLSNYGVTLDRANGYDHIYVANKCKAYYLGSSVPDESYLCLYVRDTIDGAELGDGHVMREWYAEMVSNGEVVMWEDFV